MANNQFVEFTDSAPAEVTLNNITFYNFYAVSKHASKMQMHTIHTAQSPSARSESYFTFSCEENHTLFASQLEFIQARVEATVSLFTFILDLC